MLRRYEYCTQCKGLRTVSTSISLRNVLRPGGTEEKVIFYNYHCDACLSFLLSVPLEEKDCLGYTVQVSSIPHY